MIINMKEKPMGFYITYIREKIAIGISVTQDMCREKGRALNIYMRTGRS